MTAKPRTVAECLIEAERAEAEALVVSFQPHRDQLLAIAREWRALAQEAARREAGRPRVVVPKGTEA